jgi:uncharacterized repeat protein (TIGR03803 family)
MYSALSPSPSLRLHSASPRELRTISPHHARHHHSALSTKIGLIVLAIAFAASTAQARVFFVIDTFRGQDGSSPETMSLVQGTDGNFYGTTSRGGTNNSGTVFRMPPGGPITALYDFCSQPNCTDGDFPFAGIALASDGNFYGMTAYGGANNKGMIYKVTPSGNLTVLHSFNTTDGATPESTLIQGGDGALYGTTVAGGANNFGTVFRFTLTGTLTTLYSFCNETNCADGSYPIAGVVQGKDGNFYGVTEGSDSLVGTAFKLTPSGSLTTLHTFCNALGFFCTEGAYPYGALVQAVDGSLYGATYYGGSSGFGTIFRVTPAGIFNTIHTFTGNDGASPISPMILATDGNFYGTTEIGGLTSSGTIYRLTPEGTLVSLYSMFCESSDCPDGADPYGGLLQSTDGSLYGTTFTRGPGGGGVAFNFTTGLAAFVKTVPTSGKVGTNVRILGTQLTGAKSVTFNGIAARFSVVSSAEILTVVPAGATTGNVQVKTPGGVLTSNVPFRVP